MHPATEPYDWGLLDVGDGNQIYWETCGNPQGKPALVIHGGPGSGCVAGMRQPFDPSRYRIILFDQRQCGRSTPNAGDPLVDVAANTTDHLIADMELLRNHLGVDRWLLVAWSWGTTLALAYAEQHPDRVTELALVAVTTTGPWEVRWITRDVGALFPEEWARFRDGLPEGDRDGSIVDGYARLLADPDPAVRELAAQNWCDWEDSHISLVEPRKSSRYDDPAYRLCFARLVTHYWRHCAWRADGELLEGVDRIAHIPAVLIHGRLDVSCPSSIPWQLAQRWPAARLHIVTGAGHTSGGAMGALLMAALEQFAGPV